MPIYSQELNDKYKNNLSVTSNDPAIIQRDQSGNMSTDLADIIYIEPVTWAYDNNSINKIIDTRFSYYKFPPRVIISDSEIPIDLDTDINIDAEVDTIDFNSRYKAEPQFIPTIPLLVPRGREELGVTDQEINYGWNEPIEPEEFNAIREESPYDDVVWDNSLIDGRKRNWNESQRPYTNTTTRLRYQNLDKTSKAALRTKYFRAQEIALKEIAAGESTGRYIMYNGDFSIPSLFEGFFRTIKFTEVIEGLPQAQAGKFLITKDLIESNKSLEFNIQVAVSHYDNHAKNTFAIRLIRTRPDAPVDQPYKVLAIVSSMEQGNRATRNDNAVALEKIANTKKIKEATEQAVLKTTEQIREYEEIFRLADLNFLQKLQQYNRSVTSYENRDWGNGKTRKKTMNADEKVKNEALITRNIAENDWNYYKSDLKVKEQQLNTANFNYKAALDLYDVDIKDPETILNGQHTFLWPSKTNFKLHYTLRSSDMVKGDIYSVEMLAQQPISLAHELIEENTFWDIKEISAKKNYSAKDELDKYFNPNDSLTKSGNFQSVDIIDRPIKGATAVEAAAPVNPSPADGKNAAKTV
jgi:hypothetical protein